MGGFMGTQTPIDTDYVERYDPATNTWTNMSKLPLVRLGGLGPFLTMK